jgi:peptide/nickel transport system permease protein
MPLDCIPAETGVLCADPTEMIRSHSPPTTPGPALPQQNDWTFVAPDIHKYPFVAERLSVDLKVYLARRLVLFVLVILGVMVITFFLTRVIPINPIAALAGPYATPTLIASLERKFGLDQPIYIQFLVYFEDLFTGNLGISYQTSSPVWNDVRRLLPATLELTTLGFFFTIVFGVLEGSVAALLKNSPIDRLLRVFSLLGISMPAFWLGLVTIVLFSVWIPLFPAGGRLTFTAIPPPFVTGAYTIDSLLAGNLSLFWDALDHLLLPALVLGFWGSAWIMRHTRSSILEVAKQDFITMARAKGLSGWTIFRKHTLRNGLIAPLTIGGLIYGSLLSAAIPIEIVFTYSGIGQYDLYAVQSGDFNALVAVALFAAISVALANLVVDMLYPLVDPRIKYD